MGIEIFIWNKRVGGLVKTPQGIAFEYDREFIKTGNSPILLKKLLIPFSIKFGVIAL